MYILCYGKLEVLVPAIRMEGLLILLHKMVHSREHIGDVHTENLQKLSSAHFWRILGASLLTEQP